MAKVKSYNQDSETYQNLIKKFLDKFELYFNEANVKIEDIRNLFYQNLKSIKRHDGVVSFKIPLLGHLSGVYNGAIKKLEYTEYDEATIIHEMFHALSAKALRERESIIKVFAVIYFGQKQLSVREFEEGMTEYLTTCLMGEEYKHVRFNYSQETTIVNKLAKIYGDEIILEYYLGFNNNLIDSINKDLPNGFKKVVQLCQKASTNGEIPVSFEPTKYYKKNDEVVYDDLLFDLFSKKKLVEVNTLEDFKHNLKQLFYFYESDLYKLCYEISNEEEEFQNSSNSEMRYWNTRKIEQMAMLFKNFDNILKKQWKKLNIDNEELYNNLVLDEIEHFNEFATPIILDYLDCWNSDIIECYRKRSQKNNDRDLEKLEENNSNNLVNDDSKFLVEDRDLVFDNMNKEQLESLKEMVVKEHLEDNSRGFKR